MKNNSDMDVIPGLWEGQFQGLDAWLIQTGKASAAISKFGGQLLSWCPANQDDVLWLSPSIQTLPTPIRGGIPVCWPYFSRQGQREDAPAHGHVRTQAWQLDRASVHDNGDIALDLRPRHLEAAPLCLRMELIIGSSVQQRLITTNTGTDSAPLTQALHSYFRVSDVGAVRLAGVDGLTYQDKYAAGGRFEQRGSWYLDDPRDPGRCDRIYDKPGGHYCIDDPGMARQIEIRTQGSGAVVVWSPGWETATGMADVGPHWRQYLCVEAANAGDDVRVLPPQSGHVLEQTITVKTIL